MLWPLCSAAASLRTTTSAERSELESPSVMESSGRASKAQAKKALSRLYSPSGMDRTAYPGVCLSGRRSTSNWCPQRRQIPSSLTSSTGTMRWTVSIIKTSTQATIGTTMRSSGNRAILLGNSTVSRYAENSTRMRPCATWTSGVYST